MKYLIDHDIKFIIRVKGNGKNLDVETKIAKGNKNYNDIMEIRDRVRIVNCESTYTKTIYCRKSKTL